MVNEDNLSFFILSKNQNKLLTFKLSILYYFRVEC